MPLILAGLKLTAVLRSLINVEGWRGRVSCCGFVIHAAVQAPFALHCEMDLAHVWVLALVCMPKDCNMDGLPCSGWLPLGDLHAGQAGVSSRHSSLLSTLQLSTDLSVGGHHTQHTRMQMCVPTCTHTWCTSACTHTHTYPCPHALTFGAHLHVHKHITHTHTDRQMATWHTYCSRYVHMVGGRPGCCHASAQCSRALLARFPAV